MSAESVILRQAVLLARIAQQRRDLAVLAGNVEPQLKWLDHGISLAQTIKRNSGLLLGAGLLIALVFRKQSSLMSSFITMGFSGLKIARWALSSN